MAGVMVAHTGGWELGINLVRRVCAPVYGKALRGTQYVLGWCGSHSKQPIYVHRGMYAQCAHFTLRGRSTKLCVGIQPERQPANSFEKQPTIRFHRRPDGGAPCAQHIAAGAAERADGLSDVHSGQHDSGRQETSMSTREAGVQRSVAGSSYVARVGLPFIIGTDPTEKKRGHGFSAGLTVTTTLLRQIGNGPRQHPRLWVFASTGADGIRRASFVLP